MIFVAVTTIVILVGGTIHVFVDKKGNKRTGFRILEIYFVWFLAANGVSNALQGYGHMGPMRAEIADSIGPGYIPSMFQWENAWADVGVGVLLFISAFKRNGFLTASVVMWAILYWGDAIGHVMQLVVHDNRAPANVWSIPSDIALPLIGIALLIAYRKMSPRSEPTITEEGDD